MSQRPGPTHAPEAVLELHQLRLRYPGSRQWTLDGLDLRIGSGEHLALVGPSGCGKSTVARTALQLLPPGSSCEGGLLESEIVLEGVPITLLDTAGIRTTTDAVEQLGIARSHDALASADLVLLLFDLGEGWTPDDQALLEQIPHEVPHLLVGNKADLGVAEDPACESRADVRLSAQTGDGEAELVQALLQRCGALSEQPLLLALNQRQADLASLAALALQRSDEVAAQGLPWDFWTIDLRAAVRSLGEITGAEVTEAVLDRIFSRFCIGK